MAISGAEHGLSPIPNKRREHGQTFNKRLAAGALAGVISLGAVAGLYEVTQGNKDNKPSATPSTLSGETVKQTTQPSDEITLPSPKPVSSEFTTNATFGHGMDQFFNIEGLSVENQARVEALKFWYQTVQSKDVTLASPDGESQIHVRVDSNALGSFGDEIPTVLSAGFSQTPLIINYDYVSITPQANGKAAGERSVGKIELSNISESQFEATQLSNQVADQAKNDGVDIVGKVKISADQKFSFNTYKTEYGDYLDQAGLEKYFAEKVNLPENTGTASENVYIYLYRQNGQWHFGQYGNEKSVEQFYPLPIEASSLSCDPNQVAQYCNFQKITHLP